MNIWALTDSRIGNSKQTLALAGALGAFMEKKIEFGKISKLPNKILGRSLVGVKGDFSGAKPDVIISAGRKLARVSAALKKQYKCQAIHIMYPGAVLAKKMDYVIIPSHDAVADTPNIIKITGAICESRKTAATVKAGMRQVAVLVGNLTENEARDLAEVINKNKALYFITTSRRSDEKAVSVLETQIRQPHKLYKYGSKEKNPYNEYLDSADIIIVTGDSVNMCTEAAHTGKPIYIVEVETKEKFHKFWQELYSLGIARKLADKLEMWEYKALDNLKAIKAKIKL